MEFSETVYPNRIKSLNQRPINPDGKWIIYWMTSCRRFDYNYALQHAVNKSKLLNRPLIVLEALRLDYPWASDRLHSFILKGMEQNALGLAQFPVYYYPFVEKKFNEGKGLLRALASEACLVVTDEFPCFFIPNMLKKAAQKINVLLQAVDSCGIIPLAATEKEYTAAVHFRRFVHKNIEKHLLYAPLENPFQNTRLPCLDKLPEKITNTWPLASKNLLSADPKELAGLPINHSITPVKTQGGVPEAKKKLDYFIKNGLLNYLDRNQPKAMAESGLSPYLHFGHISAHEIFNKITHAANWTPMNINPKATAKRQGFWGSYAWCESFLDQFITWRELGYHFCYHRKDYAEYASLPSWALKTLDIHKLDPRPRLYSLQELEKAQTHDPIWNAAQNQLLAQGTIHNYLRMLWGKKIIQWSLDPETALKTMLELNNRYALDGRDPNSYSGIFWCLGRFDRAWQERPIFGKIRYMTSQSTKRKLDLTEYLKKFS